MKLAPLLSPPRPLVRAGVRWMTRRTTRRLNSVDADSHAQQQAYAALIAAAARCDFPTSLGVERGLDYADFRERVPLHTYEDLLPSIELMREGRADVLAPGRCTHYAISSGTTAGRTKFLPVNAAMVGHFRSAGLEALLFFAHRTGNPSVFEGRHLFLGGSTALQSHRAETGFVSWSGDLSGITAAHLPAWAEQHLYEPGREIALVADWPAKIEAIAARTRSRDIALVAGIPSWLLILAEALKRGTPAHHVGELWPRLQCLMHGGVPLAPYVETLRAAYGPAFQFHEVFPASEGFIAAQDAESEAGLRLLTRHGIFYEFLPLRDYVEDRRADLGARCVSLAEVEPNVDYVLVMTTPAGLLRYIIGDVVRFVSVHPPRLVYAGRTRLQLSAFGEHVSERDLTLALSLACRDLGVQAAHFHAAPRFADPLEPGSRGHHEWVIELQPGGRIQNPNTLSNLVDRRLMHANDDYEAKRLGGGLAAPLVHIAPAGTFEAWLRARGKWGGQNKMPRCRSDRAIIDTLLGTF